MKPKDYINKKAAEEALKAYQGTQLNNNQETSPFFVGKINADRTKITDPADGRQYDLIFTGNPKEFELAQKLSDNKAVVNAAPGKTINVDGDNGLALTAGWSPVEGTFNQFQEFFVFNLDSSKRYVVSSDFYPSTVSLGQNTVTLWCQLSDNGRNLFMASFPNPNINQTGDATITCLNSSPSSDPESTLIRSDSYDFSPIIYWSVMRNIKFQGDTDNLIITSDTPVLKGSVSLRQFYLDAPYVYSDIGPPYSPPQPPDNPNSHGYYIIAQQDVSTVNDSFLGPYGFSFGVFEQEPYLYFYTNTRSRSGNSGFTTFVLDVNPNVHDPGQEIWQCFTVTTTTQTGINDGIIVLDILNSISAFSEGAYAITASAPENAVISTNLVYTEGSFGTINNFSHFIVSPSYSQALKINTTYPQFADPDDGINSIYRSNFDESSGIELEEVPIVMTQRFNVSYQEFDEFCTDLGVNTPSFQFVRGRLYSSDRFCFVAPAIGTGINTYVLVKVSQDQDNPDSVILKALKTKQVLPSLTNNMTDVLFK